jgi:hypothetical protein
LFSNSGLAALFSLSLSLSLNLDDLRTSSATPKHTPKTAAVVLSGGRPPVQAELDLASRARETLAAVARALPPRALLAGPGAGAGGGVGGENSNNNRIDGDKLARLSAVERTVQNMGMLPPVVVVPAPTVAAAAGTAAAGGATAEEVAPQQQQK